MRSRQMYSCPTSMQPYGLLSLLFIVLIAQPFQTVMSYQNSVGGLLHQEAVDLTQTTAEAHGSESQETKTMESLLHWAIANSDPETLREHAQQRVEDEAIAALKERQERVKQLMNIMNQQPTEGQLMKEAIEVLNHPEATMDHRLHALQALQILVEPIDNANDLHSMGGIKPVVAALQDISNSSLQAQAAYILGTAASNNPTFQQHLVEAEPDIFVHLTKLLETGGGDTLIKALYAAAALVRNTDTMRQAFYAAGGVTAVQQVLSKDTAGSKQAAGHDDARAQRKALTLLMDLVQLDASIAQACLEAGIPATIIRLVDAQDSDLQEKALHAVTTLLTAGVEPEKTRAAFHAASAGTRLQELHDLLLSQILSENQAIDLDNQYVKYLLHVLEEAQKHLGLPKPTGLGSIADDRHHASSDKSEL